MATRYFVGANVTPIPLPDFLEWDTLLDSDDWPIPGDLAVPFDFVQLPYNVGWTIEVDIEFSWTGTEHFDVVMYRGAETIQTWSFDATGGTSIILSDVVEFPGQVTGSIGFEVIDRGSTNLTTTGNGTVDGDKWKVSIVEYIPTFGEPWPLQPGDIIATMLGDIEGIDTDAFGSHVYRVAVIRNRVLVGVIEAKRYFGESYPNEVSVFNWGVEISSTGDLFVGGIPDGNASPTMLQMIKWTKEGVAQGDIDRLILRPGISESNDSFHRHSNTIYALDEALGFSGAERITRLHTHGQDGLRTGYVDLHEGDGSRNSMNILSMDTSPDGTILYVNYDLNTIGRFSGGATTGFRTPGPIYIWRYNRTTGARLDNIAIQPAPSAPPSGVYTYTYLSVCALSDGSIIVGVQSNIPVTPPTGLHHGRRYDSTTGMLLQTYTFPNPYNATFYPPQVLMRDYENDGWFYAGFEFGGLAHVHADSGFIEWIDIFPDRRNLFGGYYWGSGAIGLAQYVEGVGTVFPGIARVPRVGTTQDLFVRTTP